LTGAELSRAYLAKARLRLEVLQLLAARQGWSDLVREAQELVELATKAMLRHVGIDPPRLHDVGPVLLVEQGAFPPRSLPRLLRWPRPLSGSGPSASCRSTGMWSGSPPSAMALSMVSVRCRRLRWRWHWPGV